MARRRSSGWNAQVHITGADFALFAGLGVLAAVIAIATMTGVTRIERFLRRQALPRWVSPAIGGFVVGMIATIYQRCSAAVTARFSWCSRTGCLGPFCWD